MNRGEQKKPEDLKTRTKAFALRIIKLYVALPKRTEAQVMGTQEVNSSFILPPSFFQKSLLQLGLVLLIAGGAVGAELDLSAIKSLDAKSFVVPGMKGMRMIRIESGTFMMGSPSNEVGRAVDETQHKVTISRPFYMAETETTQEQYLPIMRPDYHPILLDRGRYGHSVPELHQGGSFLTADGRRRELRRRPMDGQSWEESVEFAKQVTERERAAGRLPKGYVYRLPTEAEWEYACRAGTSGRFNVDEKNVRLFCVHGREGLRPLEQLLFLSPQLFYEPLDVIGSRKPNAWGLYDMHGNLYEWCLDWYGPYPKGNASDPAGPQEGTRRVARGGSYISGQGAEYLPDLPGFIYRYVRSASRNNFRPDHIMRIHGIRLVLAPAIASD